MSTRIKITIFTISCIFCILTAILFKASYTKGAFYAQRASGQHITETKLHPVRGNIYDRNMISFTNTQTQQYVFNQSGLKEYYNGENQNGYIFEALARYRKNGYARHLIGYLNDDYSGASGLEKLFDKELKTDKYLNLVHNNTASGAPSYTQNYNIVNNHYLPNSNLKLTLDYKVQKCAEDAMDKYIQKGGVVILDAKSFDVLAMASRPNFEQRGIKGQLNDNAGEFLNRSISSYDAGSIFKIITSASALKNTDYTNEHQFVCNGSIQSGNLTFNCTANHGILNFKTAFAKSCNCAFYSIGMHIGSNAILNTAKNFGLGSKVSNIEALETMGNLPNENIYSVNAAINLSIGQGEMLITPLQAAKVAAIIANRGVAYDVNIADSIVNKDGAVLKDLRKYGSQNVLDAQTADFIAQMMREAVLEGTAQSAQNGIFGIAGKTGTAQTGWYNIDTQSLNVHGWFIGFFPYDNPKYAMAVFCEDGKSGATSAIPPFKEIALNLMNCT